MLCKVCLETSSKYKCSTCHIPYCSLNCWKNHKSGNDCKIKIVSNERNENVYVEKTKYFTEDMIKEDKLILLGESKKLKMILKNPYLQNTLKAVNNSSNPEEALRQAMKNSEFVEFVDECLKIVEDSND